MLVPLSICIKVPIWRLIRVEQKFRRDCTSALTLLMAVCMRSKLERPAVTPKYSGDHVVGLESSREYA